ncbi:ATP-binding protein [Streptomyces longwoodensis]|uniref:ATP-binding protein n=1 Tax=Streptomyces longwoodensis TaxID=68231 RepID=UPI0033E7D1BF
MLELSGERRPDPDPRYGAYPQPPLGAGHASAAYEPRPTSVRQARREVRRRLEEWGLGERGDLVETAELLVSELATNALLHSATPFRLTVSAAHGVLRCEVTDGGPRAPRVLGAGRPPTVESGRGMFLVEALARRWGCHREGPGKTVWFELGTCACDGCGRRQP